MKVIIKSLEGKSRDHEITLNTTVGALRAEIAKENGVLPPQIKLVHKGVILTVDDKKAVDCGVHDGDFIVCMVTKSVSAVAPKKEESVPVPASKPKPVEEKKEQKETAPTSAHDQTVKNLMAMGFSKANVELALQAAEDNQEHAIEFLLNV